MNKDADNQSQVVVLRQNTPWKLAQVERHEGDTIILEGGFQYHAVTGERLDRVKAVSNERIVPPTPERLAYLEVRAFLKDAPHVRLKQVTGKKMMQLAELVRAFRQLLDEQ